MQVQTVAAATQDFRAPSRDGFRVALFAYNEERRVGHAIASLLRAHVPLKIFVLINGCTDRTLEVVRSFDDPAVTPVLLDIADKCNAWNYYVYHLADDAPCHFFMDGDVRCRPGTLERMADELLAHPEATVIAGAPQSGRNRAYYQDIQRRWNWVYGNLYGVAAHRIRRIIDLGIRLPLGLKGNDHVITQLLTGDLPAREPRLGSRMLVKPDLGYEFDPLQPFRPVDLKIYWKRRVTYCLRQFQIGELEKNLLELPATMDTINRTILERLNARSLFLHPIERAVRARLRRMYPTANARYYDKLLNSAA
jgi:glycosyltransferase involved in cell wall biosynthesis